MSPEERQRIVEASWKAGTSVNAVARAYGVRASQIYQWRKRHRKQARSSTPTTLLPVEVAEGIRPQRGAKQHDFRIMIEVRGSQVTLDGSVGLNSFGPCWSAWRNDLLAGGSADLDRGRRDGSAA